MLTDTTAKLIIENEVIPSMKTQDYSTGIAKGTRAILASITPEAIELAAANARKERIRSARRAKEMGEFFSSAGIILVLSLISFGVIWLLTIPQRRRRKAEKAERLKRKHEARMREIRVREEARQRANALLQKRRRDILNAMTPHQREVFLANEAEELRQKKLAQERRIKQELEAQAAAAQRRNSYSYPSSSYGGSSSSSDSSWSSGGGSSYDGGGASGGW